MGLLLKGKEYLCASFMIVDGKDLGAKPTLGIDKCIAAFFMHRYVLAAKIINCCTNICSSDINYSLANVKQFIWLNVTLKAQINLV